MWHCQKGGGVGLLKVIHLFVEVIVCSLRSQSIPAISPYHHQYQYWELVEYYFVDFACFRIYIFWLENSWLWFLGRYDRSELAVQYFFHVLGTIPKMGILQYWIICSYLGRFPRPFHFKQNLVHIFPYTPLAIMLKNPTLGPKINHLR